MIKWNGTVQAIKSHFSSLRESIRRLLPICCQLVRTASVGSIISGRPFLAPPLAAVVRLRRAGKSCLCKWPSFATPAKRLWSVRLALSSLSRLSSCRPKPESLICAEWRPFRSQPAPRFPEQLSQAIRQKVRAQHEVILALIRPSSHHVWRSGFAQQSKLI